MRRIGNNDPFHPIFTGAIEFLTETRFFGKMALETTLHLIDGARHVFYAAYALNSNAFPMGECQRIDRDAERLTLKAKGKLAGKAMQYAETQHAIAEARAGRGKMPETAKRKQSGESSRSVLQRYTDRVR